MGEPVGIFHNKSVKSWQIDPLQPGLFGDESDCCRDAAFPTVIILKGHGSKGDRRSLFLGTNVDLGFKWKG